MFLILQYHMEHKSDWNDFTLTIEFYIFYYDNSLKKYFSIN